MINQQRAFSLIEILVVLSILAILATIAIPSFTHLTKTYEANAVIQRLANVIRIAKLTAINKGQNTIVCPDPEGKKCSSDWTARWVTFTDANRNLKLDPNEKSSLFSPTINAPEKIMFNGHQNMIRFSSSGFPLGTFGSFTYCPHPLQSDFVRKLVINMQGQIKTQSLTEKQALEVVLQCQNGNS